MGRPNRKRGTLPVSQVLKQLRSDEIKDDILDLIIGFAVKYKISVEDAYTLFNKSKARVKLISVQIYNHATCDCEKPYEACPYNITKSI